MIVEFEKNKLAQALRVAAGCVGEDAILSMVLLDADAEDGCTLSATDLSREVKLRVSAKVKSFGSTAVDARLLKNFADNAPGEVMTVTLQDRALLAQAMRATCAVPVADPASFPGINARQHGVSLTVGGAFAQALNSASFCCDDGLSHVYLTGVHVRPESDHWSLVATNRHKLCQIKVPEQATFAPFVYPKKSAAIAASLFGENESDFFLTESTLTLSNEVASFTSKLVDATFPDISRIMQKGPHQVSANRGELLAAVRLTAGIHAKEGKVGISFKSGHMVVRAAKAGGASARAEVPCEGSAVLERVGDDGEAFEVTIAEKYLSSLLAFLKGEVVQLYFESNRMERIIMTGGDPDVTTLVMPMQ